MQCCWWSKKDVNGWLRADRVFLAISVQQSCNIQLWFSAPQLWAPHLLRKGQVEHCLERLILCTYSHNLYIDINQTRHWMPYSVVHILPIGRVHAHNLLKLELHAKKGVRVCDLWCIVSSLLGHISLFPSSTSSIECCKINGPKGLVETVGGMGSILTGLLRLVIMSFEHSMGWL